MSAFTHSLRQALVWKRGRRTALVIAVCALALLAWVSISISLPDTEVRVTSFEPTGWTEANTNLTIRFSKPMVSKDSLDQPVLDPPVTFSPPLHGLARWVETDVLRFFPDGSLAPATEYVARVASDKTWSSGLKILSKAEFRFWTSFLSATSITGTTESVPDQADQVNLIIRINFNYAVSYNDLRKSIRLTGQRNAVLSNPRFTLVPLSDDGSIIPIDTGGSGNQDLYTSQFQMTTEPFKQSNATQSYLVTIDKGIGCRNCGKLLADPIKRSIEVAARERLVVNSVSARSDASGGSIYVYMTLPISPDAAKRFVSLSPDHEFTLESDWTSLVIRGKFGPGESITLNLAKGLPSTGASVLETDFSTKVSFPDLEPAIAFSSVGTFVPRRGNGLIEVKTTNVDKVEVEVEQIFPNNLVYFLTSGYGGYDYYSGRQGQLGRSLFIKQMNLDLQKNIPLVTTLDLKSFVGDTTRGIFKVSVRDKERRWTGDSRYAMITDIGIAARMSDNYLTVWANSLANLDPVPNAAVALISRNNQTLVEGKTDSRGIATFEGIKDKLAGFEPFVITVIKDKDLAYLRLDESLLPIADFDVAGRPFLSAGYEAFLYTDRGVYRPGDTAHIVSIVRGADAKLPPAFPYFLTLYDVRGKKFAGFRVGTEGTAITTLDFPIPDFAGTGRYNLVAEIGDNLKIGQADFQVEDFMPDRIKVALSTPRTSYRAGDTITAAINAKFLFGPPAAHHRVSGHLTIEPADFAPSGWTGYSFSNRDRTFTRMEIDLKDTLLDDTGGHRYSYIVPDKMLAPSFLKGLLSATVSEQGGRGVSAYTELQIHPYVRYIGLKLNLAGYAEPGKPVDAQVVAVDPSGKPVEASQTQIRFYRLVYNTVLKKDRTGIYRYVSERRPQLVDSTSLGLTASGGKVTFTPGDYGSYQIVATDLNGGHSTEVEFYASGWGYAPWALTDPDKIELQFDKKSYAPGDEAILQVRAPFGGKLLVTVERTTLLDAFTRPMSDNTAELRFPVKKEYFPNCYVTVEVIRPADSLEPNMPARAFGIVPLRLSSAAKQIQIALSAPDEIKPNTKLTVEVKTSMARKTQVTVAAVDAGILQLTDFQTPDPLEFFYGKKQPCFKAYDLYSFIYPRVNRAQSHLASGGDTAFAASRMRHLNPISARRVKPVSLWSGLISTDETGKARVTFAVPEFNGKLTLMAVAAQGDLFGSATGEVLVRDKIVLQESFPRFVSPNDVFNGLVTVFNNTGSRADIAISAAAEGPVEFVSPTTTTVSLENNREGAAIFKIKAKLAPGKVSFTIKATAGADSSSITVELPNRPAVPLVTQAGSGIATKGSPAEFTLPAGWLPGTDQYVIRTSGMPATTFAKNIQYLLSYPYGCVEQTTSRLFPMLYFNDMVKVVDPALYGGKAPDYFIQEGILKLNSMLLPDKSFAYWPGGTRSDNWTSIYASLFLSEASRAGYYVDKKLLDDLYEHLGDIADGKWYHDVTDAHRIYAAYVLAQAGKLEHRTVSYLKGLDPSRLQPYSRYQLAGALLLSGNSSDLIRLLPAEIQPSLFDPETGGDFNSAVRTDAILLDVLVQATPNSPSVPVLARSLMEEANAGRWYTTQDNAFALMALGKYFRSQSHFDYSGTIHIDGEQPTMIDSTSTVITRKDLGNRHVSINITGGNGPCFYYWQASGVPVSNATPEFDKGLKVRRKYLDENANPVDLTRVRLGDRIIAVISVDATDRSLYNVVINDLLPAGFEIENPRLKTSERLAWIPSAEGAGIDFQDIRDDRLLLFTNLYPGRTVNYFYSLRAISAGDFKVPPISAECMYNPLIASSASSGAVTITR